MNHMHAITPLIWRVIAFLGTFIVISGLLGQRIIKGGVVGDYGFELYGGLGKAWIFGITAFVLLIRQPKKALFLHAWKPVLLWWGLALSVAFTIAWFSVSSLLAGQIGPLQLIGAHGGFTVCVLCAALVYFGTENIYYCWQSYRRELLYSAGLIVAFYVFLQSIYTLWHVLAGIVLYTVHWLLTTINGLSAIVVPPYTLVLDKFGITVAQYCSGIESIALFTSLYMLVGLLDRSRLNFKRYFVLFPFALAGLFICNILRVYGLILSGYYIDPDLAFSLFHTYAGLLFFIMYSVLFWLFAYKFLVKAIAQEQTEDA